MEETENMEELNYLGSFGRDTQFKGRVSIESGKYNSLPEENRRNVSWKGSECLEEIRDLIEIEWAIINETNKRNDHVTELTEIFKLAGFDIIYVETIDNQYCSKACCYKLPWVIVTTKKGRIKLGWRKSVMNLDWSASDITDIGTELFKDEKTTTGERYIHCWSKDKTVEYLKKLNSKE
jgi:hypothetical protein